VRSLDDNNFDGEPDEWWTYSNGTLVKMERHGFQRHARCVLHIQIWVIQQVDYMPNGAKFATQREVFQNGVLVEILQGADGRGNFKEAVQYDPFFNPITTNRPH